MPSGVRCGKLPPIIQRIQMTANQAWRDANGISPGCTGFVASRRRSDSFPPIIRAILLVLAVGFFIPAFFATGRAQVITNLQELTRVSSSQSRIERDLDIEATVCAASRPKVGVLILRDESGVELVQVGDVGAEIQPGDRIRIRRKSSFVRRREMGVQITAMPVVINDDLHARLEVSGTAQLQAGMVPVQLDWFNFRGTAGLDISWALFNQPWKLIDDTSFYHAVKTESGATNWVHGLEIECYEGTWDSVPDFNLFEPVKTGVGPNMDRDARSRAERAGVRFRGFLKVPQDGTYKFVVGSDDGAILYLGDSKVPIVRLGRGSVQPATQSEFPTVLPGGLSERLWTLIEGRVSFVTREGEGVRFEMGNGRNVISVRIADASGLDTGTLLDARVRVTGVGRGGLTLNKTVVLSSLVAASANDLVFAEPVATAVDPALPITTVAGVQSLPIELARQALPVRLRGTVTDAMVTSREHRMSFQDDTRGIFVSLTAVSNAMPAVGEVWELEGTSAAGDFAPVVRAQAMTRLGEGMLPAPVKPTWTELLNGSRDVQWAELKGVVTDIHSNSLALLLPEGRLEVQLDGSIESDLRPFEKAVVRVRGVLYAEWDRSTREVRVGRVMMRNPTICVDVPAPADPFDAVLKSPRELLLFDAQATPFRPVKVRGQIVYADDTQLVLQDGGTGIRLLPASRPDVRPGDLVEAVGFAGIARAELYLHEARVRRTGAAPLPPAVKLGNSQEERESLNWTRVSAEGNLLGFHLEDGVPVLEIQSAGHLFMAKLPKPISEALFPRLGSHLAMQGVYVRRGREQGPSPPSESFDLWLNSVADITVLSQPSWWTLPRLLVLMGILLAVLTTTIIWNTQLRRLVDQRTVQLQTEIRERERVERQHALEAERSRIARDLHDDLGSSLTEITVLASRGQLSQANAGQQPSLFQTIGAKARSLVSALDVIVWAVDPEDNSLQSLADYLSGYADDFFAHTTIACRFKVPVSFPSITLEGRVRHDLLLAVKEALNNIVRHAAATEVEFRMAMTGGVFEIDIADNGKGIEGASHKGAHGLRNLSARLKKLGGDCSVESRPGPDGGTQVQIRLPLARLDNQAPGAGDAM